MKYPPEYTDYDIQTIYLAGNPNCGKTSIFNLLAGLRQKVSNIPGTTVEKVEGVMTLDDHRKVTLIDLPGAYTLYPKSEDELVACRSLLQAEQALVVFVADAGRLQSNLFYYTQVADLGLPTVLVLNMIDVAEEKGIHINTEQLSAQLGVLVVETSARQNKGFGKLRAVLSKKHPPHQTYFAHTSAKSVETHIQEYKLALTQAIDSGIGNSYTNTEDAEMRQRKISDILSSCVQVQPASVKGFLKKADPYLMHPVWGMILMLGMLLVVFQSVFSLAEWPMQGIEWLFSTLGGLIKQGLPDGFIQDFLVEGLVSGLSGIVVFLPQILILFFFIGLMEETGYITRVSFLTDRFMRYFGLNGKSVIPLAGGLACAIPSVMAARSIENKAEKLATILITPLMTCSARLPVYTLLISLMVPEEASLGWFNLRGIILFGMYLLGFVGALIFAVLFKLFIRSKVNSFFILELPDLRPPRWGSLWYTLYRKGMTFLMGAGKVILVVSVVLFFLKSYGPGDRMSEVREQFAHPNRALQEKWGDNLEAGLEASLLEASYAGQIGHWIAPVIRPLGFDWKIGIAIMTSFAAREVFVGTMSAIYGVADDEEGLGLRARLQQETDPETGKPVYDFAVLCSLLLFYAFALQCMSTVAIVYKETNSFRWPALQILAMTGTAYLLSMITYQWLA
jgi:ferrous iron transport protein B